MMTSPHPPHANADEAYRKTTVEVLKHGFRDCDAELADRGVKDEVMEHLGRVKEFRGGFVRSEGN